MTDKGLNDIFSMPVPYPYLVTATDQYYGVNQLTEEKKRKEKSKKPSTGNTKRKNLRILITTYWDYPAVGGLQNYISILKAGLEKLGHIVDVIAPNQFPRDVTKKLKKKIS